jgi:hypothetical protein
MGISREPETGKTTMKPRTLSTLLLALALSLPTASAVCGDCDGSGSVDIIDALVGAQHGAGLLTLTGQQFLDCDTDGAGTVDVLDALRVAQAAAGLQVPLTCTPANQAPVLTWLHHPTSDEGLVPLYYRLSDAESDLVDVTLEWSTDGGSTWSPLSRALGLTVLSLTQGLSTSVAGTEQLFVWDTVTDLPGHTGRIDLRGRATDAAPGPLATTQLDLDNGGYGFSVFAECIPRAHRWPDQAPVDFLVIARNATGVQQTLDFPSSCQHHYLLDGGAFDSGQGIVCLAVLTSAQVPANGVYEWPMQQHESRFHHLTPGTHTIEVYLPVFGGPLSSAPIGLEIY